MDRQFGDKGFILINNTTAHTGLKCYGFTVLQEATIEDAGDTAIVVDTNLFPGYTASSLADVVFPPGFYPIPFTSIKLVSGALLGWYF